MVKDQGRVLFYDQIARNKRNSVFLIIIILAVLLALGYLIGFIVGPAYFTLIMIAAIIISILYIWLGYYYSDKIALASVNAVKADPTKYRSLYNSVESMSLASGMPMPQVYVMQNPQINAFATGRDPKHAVVCVTTGSLDKLNKEELEGVIAHEMSHVANFDIRFMTLVAVLVGMIAIISEIFLRTLWFSGGRDSGGDNDRGNAIFMIIGIVLAILAPILVYLVQLSISRKREYTADASAVKFTRRPTGLISALKKIKAENEPLTREEASKVSKVTASLFISNPFTKENVENMFSTHPPISKRISVLERM
ncbi:MAG: M48 family metallopeptidase [Candidatus Pacearchaeota archaeon]|jgi:heat shock protein HtpX